MKPIMGEAVKFEDEEIEDDELEHDSPKKVKHDSSKKVEYDRPKKKLTDEQGRTLKIVLSIVITVLVLLVSFGGYVLEKRGSDTDDNGFDSTDTDDDDSDDIVADDDVVPVEPPIANDWDGDRIEDSTDEFIYIALTDEDETTSYSHHGPFMQQNDIYYITDLWWLFSDPPYIDKEYLRDMALPSEEVHTHYTFESSYDRDLGRYMDPVYEIVVFNSDLYITKAKTIKEGTTTYQGCSSSIIKITSSNATVVFKSSEKFEYYEGLRTDGNTLVYGHQESEGGSSIEYYSSKNTKTIENGNDSHRAPDVYGDYIVYSVTNSSKNRIDLFKISTQTSKVMANAEENISYISPRISGNDIVWVKKAKSNNTYSLEICDINTIKTRTLVSGKSYLNVLDFDEEWLVYQTKLGEDYVMVLMNRESGEERYIFDGYGTASIGTDYVSFSDGTNLYYTPCLINW